MSIKDDEAGTRNGRWIRPPKDDAALERGETPSVEVLESSLLMRSRKRVEELVDLERSLEGRIRTRWE